LRLRKYSNEKIVELIYSSKPENWPEFATPMPPLPQVPKAEAIKIASWINSPATLDSNKTIKSYVISRAAFNMKLPYQ